MTARRLSLILGLIVLPPLSACGEGDAAGPPPLSEAALSAVVERPGVPRERLARAVDALFTDEDLIGETRAVVVMHNGRIVAERYRDGYSKDTPLIGWSMSKTVTAVMIGMLIADGRLRLNESAPIPRWQRPGDPRGEITLKQLLQMRSGLRHSESTDSSYDADTVRMLFLDGRRDTASYAEAQPLEAEPGRMFEYSSATTVILADAAANALTDRRVPDVRRRAVGDYLRTRLLEPVGLKSMTGEYDEAGTLLGSSMIRATARDWGKFGEFLRHGGSVRGAQVVPRGWIDFMKAPSPREKAYGAQLWLNHEASDGSGRKFPTAPGSAFALMGHLGQYVLVSPTQHLTVVRLGNTPSTLQPALRRRIGDVAALYIR